MLKTRSPLPYWTQFQKYQTFETFDELKAAIKSFQKKYQLSSSMKAVLNTIKLHSKNYVGVCWLFREEIAKRSGYSVASVDRAIQAFKEVGLLRVIHWMNNKRGGQSHNIYIINNEPCEEANEKPNEEASDPVEQYPNPCPSRVSETVDKPYNNLNNNSNKNSHNLFDNVDNLKSVPKEFKDIMNPYYGNKPDIIKARWKSTCIAAKNWCHSIKNARWDTILEAWKESVLLYKNGELRNSTDDGLAGYYYRNLCGKLLDDYARRQE